MGREGEKNGRKEMKCRHRPRPLKEPSELGRSANDVDSNSAASPKLTKPLPRSRCRLLLLLQLIIFKNETEKPGAGNPVYFL